ncbi:hypothetical protein BJ912DRAFT_636850 [Pholiota molesta]|nr:hypothetical protein BJ912DRAFT_636850 [Pholiota molesta]
MNFLCQVFPMSFPQIALASARRSAGLQGMPIDPRCTAQFSNTVSSAGVSICCFAQAVAQSACRFFPLSSSVVLGI